ncbi:hypothetical protein ACS0TY_028683 [Phlomoides rotata]
MVAVKTKQQQQRCSSIFRVSYCRVGWIGFLTFLLKRLLITLGIAGRVTTDTKSDEHGSQQQAEAEAIPER